MKNIIITISLVTVIVIGITMYFFPSDSSLPVLSVDTKTTNSSEARYIYTILKKMEKVSLDDSIFENNVFKSLKDNTVTFSPQESGRINPFAPIGSDFGFTTQGLRTSTSTSL